MKNIRYFLDSILKASFALLLVLLGLGLINITIHKASSSEIETLCSFDKASGFFPGSTLVRDSQGNIFGTTMYGGPSNNGMIFELKIDSSSSTGYSSTPTILYTFSGLGDEGNPSALMIDTKGNLFGLTFRPSFYNNDPTNGIIFELKVDPSTVSGYSSNIAILCSNVGCSFGVFKNHLVMDKEGNLFSFTRGWEEKNGPYDPAIFHRGTIYELKADTTSATGYASATTLLHTFTGGQGDGDSPSSLVIDEEGNLFGTTEGTDSYDDPGIAEDGTIFELKKDRSIATQYSATLTNLYNFKGHQGSAPSALIMDRHHHLFGVAAAGHSNGTGMIFELPYDPTTPTGYRSSVTVLHAFERIENVGDEFFARVLVDSKGNLFGVSGFIEFADANFKRGSIFEMPYDKASDSYSTYNSLYDFKDNEKGEGSEPNSALLLDDQDHLIGATQGLPIIGSSIKDMLFKYCPTNN